MKKFNFSQKISDHLFIQSLEHYLKVDAQVDRVEDFLFEAAQRGTFGLPFSLEEALPVRDRLPVLAEISQELRPAGELYQRLSEYPETVHLVSDSVLSGRESIFCCTICNDPDTIRVWVEKMSFPTLHISSCKDRGLGKRVTVIAAPIRAFFL